MAEVAARRRLRLAVAATLVWGLAATVLVGTLVTRATGESARTGSAVDRQTARLDQQIVRLERDIRADCRFKLDIAQIAAPPFNPRPSRILLQLAHDAADAYVGKGCPDATDPRTGRRFGPPPSLPPVPPPTPAPTPTRR